MTAPSTATLCNQVGVMVRAWAKAMATACLTMIRKNVLDDSCQPLCIPQSSHQGSLWPQLEAPHTHPTPQPSACGLEPQNHVPHPQPLPSANSLLCPGRVRPL
jgi:hypothetical protein